MIHSACYFCLATFCLMPTTTAAAKALRQNIAARARNKAVKDQLKKLNVQLRKAVTAKQVDQARTIVKDFIRALDRAAAKKVIHHNTTARKKSRLAQTLKRLA